jgi:hypothetical protein
MQVTALTVSSTFLRHSLPMTEKLNIQLGYPPMSEHREGLTTEAHDWTMIQAGTLIKGQKVITM